VIPQTLECPSIYDWIQTCLSCRTSSPFITLPQFVAARSESSRKSAQDSDQWIRLTPRTLLFEQLFSTMQPDWSAAQIVEALSSAGANSLVLETLPEAVLIPLQEAVVRSQVEPPAEWSKELLALVGREDVTMLLKPGQRPRQMQSTLLVSMIFSKSRHCFSNHI
jgi:anaphase-promoting complex subunit 1